MRFGNYDLVVEDCNNDKTVFVIKYVKLSENGCALCNGYIAYVPESKIYGLETYLTENDELFCYEYTTDTMGNGMLGIVRNNIEVTDSIARELSMQTSLFKSYTEFINSVDDIPKLFDRVIIDYQL